jgi:hypothetical protein
MIEPWIGGIGRTQEQRDRNLHRPVSVSLLADTGVTE